MRAQMRAEVPMGSDVAAQEEAMLVHFLPSSAAASCLVGHPTTEVAQAMTDLTLSSSVMVLLVGALLCNRLSVTRRALVRKPANWYYLVCCTLAWSAMLVWRGPKEAWPWWLKASMLTLLSLSALFIDALPIETHALLGRVGLLVIAVVSAATYFWLKANTAEMYSVIPIPARYSSLNYILSALRPAANLTL